MALASTDRAAILAIFFAVLGEDYVRWGAFVGQLELAFPSLNWRQQLATSAAAFGPFLGSGLSITWWLTTVGRYADLYKTQ